jgi:hypothetical protein
MATTFYGAGSQQVEALRRASDKYANDVDRYEFAKGCIANMVAEVIDHIRETGGSSRDSHQSDRAAS